MDPTATELACPDCGARIEPAALSCGNCHYLTHAVELEDLARKAQIAANGGDFALSRGYWAKSAELLPPESIQYKSIQAQIADLELKIAVAPPVGGNAWSRGTATLGPIAVVLWKFKTVLLGLTKMGTLLSMLASLGTIEGVQFFSLQKGDAARQTATPRREWRASNTREIPRASRI